MEVLLVGSLRNGRWGLPKGHVHAGETTEETALREAFEEAGVQGTVESVAFGSFSYKKNGNPKRFHVSVHVVAVNELSDVYPERDIRKSKWVPIARAEREASRPGLRNILKRFAVTIKGHGR
jgi:8-oxo-dGTP pyrophosphatase MutT (NUDIX family)